MCYHPSAMKKIPTIICLCLFILLVLNGFMHNTPSIEAEIVKESPVVSFEITPEISKPTAEPILKQEPKVVASAVTPPVAPKPTPVQKPVVKAPVVRQPRITPPIPAETTTPPPSPASCDGGLSSELLCLVNQYRKANGLNALSYDAALSATAVDHSTWMNDNNTMSHIGENGSTFTQRCTAHNVKCDAENVARGYTTAQKLFDAWRASPSHNANMLGKHTVMGFGLVGKFATQLFR